MLGTCGLSLEFTFHSVCRLFLSPCFQEGSLPPLSLLSSALQLSMFCCDSYPLSPNFFVFVGIHPFLYSHFIRISQRSAMFIWKSLNVVFLWENKHIFYVIVLGKLYPFVINEVMIWSLCVAPGSEKTYGWMGTLIPARGLTVIVGPSRCQMVTPTVTITGNTARRPVDSPVHTRLSFFYN